ncbi:MAG: radical SAM protein [Oscillospiraceae bacterium]|jgi:nitrogen fixation protein NifB|nr:radical SAM protein [Oscillospiraceae bacterium]
MIKLAFASNDGKYVSQHFGHALRFVIAEIDKNSDGGYGWRYIETRENDTPCEGGDHNEDKFEKSISLISDCNVLLAVKVGNHAKSRLELHGLSVLERAGYIEDLIAQYIKYLQRPKIGQRAVIHEVTKPEHPIIKRREVIDDHPCFSAKAHNTSGRLHLPVSPSCNIQCRFCTRAKNTDEQRPGVAQGVLHPDEAVETVKRALELCPQIAVVGIAGPGDTLATPHAIEAFRQVHAAYPDLIKCLSTNGLALPNKAQELWDVGVRTITVTVNAVSPDVLRKVVSWVKGDDELVSLTAAQLKGIRECADIGMTVKVNTVLIPNVNDTHIAEIAAAVKKAGASRHNIIPLIPQNEFKDTPPPTCDQIETARQAAGEYLEQFRHCKHCRADACGIPGVSDLSKELYQNRTLETFSHG